MNGYRRFLCVVVSLGLLANAASGCAGDASESADDVAVDEVAISTSALAREGTDRSDITREQAATLEGGADWNPHTTNAELQQFVDTMVTLDETTRLNVIRYWADSKKVAPEEPLPTLPADFAFPSSQAGWQLYMTNRCALMAAGIALGTAKCGILHNPWDCAALVVATGLFLDACADFSLMPHKPRHPWDDCHGNRC